MELTLFLLFIFVGLIGLIWFRYKVNQNSQQTIEDEIQKEIESLEKHAINLNPDEFFNLVNSFKSNKKSHIYAEGLNFDGIYVLHNTSKDKHYVGQSVNVIKRVNMHFGGKHSGNKDVYKDYKNGDQWDIKLISMKQTNYVNLNDLEKYAIKLYKGYDKGYNKTRGNNS